MKQIKLKKTVILIMISFGIIASAAVIFCVNMPDRNSYMDKLNSMEASMSALWVHSAGTVDELIDLSELVIEGRVVNYEPRFHDGLVFTDETVEVQKVLKGNVSMDDKIIVAVTGGEYNENITYPIKDCPIIDMRGNYMLFLDTNDGEKYFIIAGNQGFGLIKDNRIEATDKSKLGDIISNYEVDKLEEYITGKVK
jgi:hypothetical protein